MFSDQYLDKEENSKIMVRYSAAVSVDESVELEVCSECDQISIALLSLQPLTLTFRSYPALNMGDS